MELEGIQVKYQQTNDSKTALEFLKELEKAPLFAWDLEIAVKYTPAQLEHFKSILNSTTISKRTRITLQSKLQATALDHPSHCTITHCSLAASENEAYVIIIDNDKVRDVVLNFLVTTNTKQVLHNASFDFKHIYHYTKKLPKNYEDSQIRAKCILNHVETWKANTGLKELAGKWYGDWGISSDNFDISQMYQDKVIRYAATDACATYKLWESITEYVKSEGN